MFNEKSGKWIEIFKGYTFVMFWVYIAAAVLGGILGWSGEIYITDESYFWDGMICLVGGTFLAVTQLVVNMLLIQFFNNVQIIREKLENITNS